MRQLSVGENSLWGVNGEGRLIMRRGISEDTPMGKDWATVDAEPMKHVRIANFFRIRTYSMLSKIQKCHRILQNYQFSTKMYSCMYRM